MGDLIKALQILLKYGNPSYPTHCEHDILTIVDIHPSDVSSVDKVKLENLGFIVGDPWGSGGSYFYSYKYGSA